MQQLTGIRAVYAFLCIALICLAAVFSPGVSARDFTVEVIVADPGEKQRTSAYWLALDQVIKRNLPPGLIDSEQRKEVLRDPARYVQSFRYRPFDAAADQQLLMTRQVRDGDPADSVITVTFPATLAANLQRQFLPQPVQEEIAVAGSGRILALIAVEQNGEQFLIGGDRARKFQSRMLQLGAANNLRFEFPTLDEADLAIISPSNVLFNDQQTFDAMVQKYQSAGRISGALVRIGAQSWQSDWNYNFTADKNGSLSLTTRSLDEALLTALTEITSGSSTTGAGILASEINFERSGVSVRVENINSLARHQQVLQLLRSIDGAAVIEGLEPGVTVYRAPNSDVFSLQQRLASLSVLTPLPEFTSDSAIAYRLR